MMEKSGGKLFLQWETHSRQLSRGLCMLLERQCLVDIAICCGSNTMHAHKCILAANSIYFKDHLENKAIEQVIINGVDFVVMKAIVEFIYCGECVLSEEHLKHFVAAVKLFKITALENIFMENEYQSLTADEVSIAPPQFVCKPPKYPTIYKPFGCGMGPVGVGCSGGGGGGTVGAPSAVAAPPLAKVNYGGLGAAAAAAAAAAFNQQQHKMKRKFGSEAEKACAKEAQASRIALANLRKAMATTPQVHSFIVEESFNETTVENFIPNVEDGYEDFGNGNPSTAPKIDLKNDANQTLTADKIKHILGNEEVEIMFQTSDGNFVNVSDEVLLNLSKNGLQYQVVDEHGQIGELHELKTLEQQKKALEASKGHDVDMALAKDPSLPISVSQDSGKSSNLDEDAMPFGEDSLYEHTFNNAEMFEPENLSMHTDLMDDHNVALMAPTMDDGDKSAEPLDLGMQQQHHGDIVSDGDGPQKTTKFTPDMFFADLPGDQCTNVEGGGGVAKTVKP